jgi:hypothetical protein
MAVDYPELRSTFFSPDSYLFWAFALPLPFLYLLHQYFYGPLSNIPGPRILRLTSLWLVRKTHQRQRHLYDCELHERYGPVVRVGPREVSLSSPAAVKAVYGNCLC